MVVDLGGVDAVVADVLDAQGVELESGVEEAGVLGLAYEVDPNEAVRYGEGFLDGGVVFAIDLDRLAAARTVETADVAGIREASPPLATAVQLSSFGGSVLRAEPLRNRQ